MAMILASQSPRRRELLGQMGFSFTVRPAKGEELPHPELTPAQLVEELARQKALEVSAEADDVVVAADTVVAIDGGVLGKPQIRSTRHRCSPPCPAGSTQSTPAWP